MKIGVLAIQGAFIEHVRTFRSIGIETVEVRLPADLDGVAGLVLPGGESTAMRRLIDRWELREPIMRLAASGAPLFGTCAGMILVAREITSGEPAGPAAPRRDRGAQRVRSPARLVRGRPERADPRRPAGPRRVHPGPGHHPHRPRRRRPRHARRRAGSSRSARAT